MIGLLRLLIPLGDRRSSARFRDARVKAAVQGSERRLRVSASLQRELKAMETGLQKGAREDRDVCR